MKGLETQVFTISLSITTTFIVLFYKRKKMPFKFKVSDKMQSRSVPLGHKKLSYLLYDGLTD